jgi:hypothetical protein
MFPGKPVVVFLHGPSGDPQFPFAASSPRFFFMGCCLVTSELAELSVFIP